MSARELLFGADLRLHEVSWGLDLVPAAADLQLAHGVDAISQALRLRVVVRRGELAPLGWPDYGSRLHELLGQANLARTQAQAMTFAREAVEADPRVVKVTRIGASVPPGDRDVVRLDMDIDLITQQSPLNLVLDLALGAR